MKLWTIQPLNVYEKLLTQGTLHCNPDCDGFWGRESQEFTAAYDWLAGQMQFRISPPPEGVQYPFWAWALIDGVSKNPDLRRVEFNGFVGEHVILELEIPDVNVLLSDEENWHYVLGRYYLHDVHDNEGKWEENDAWFNGLSSNEQESVMRKSWEKIFDKDDSDNAWKYVQATFWELRLNQVKGTRKFVGRGKQTNR